MKPDLVTRAENLIHRDKGYLYKSSKSLVKHELNLFLKGKPNELELYVSKMEKKLKKRIKEIDEMHARQQAQRQARMKQILSNNSLSKIKKDLLKMEKEMEKCRIKWIAIKNNNPANRTMRKANLSNKMDGLARNIELLKDSVSYNS